MREVAPLCGVDSALVLTNPGGLLQLEAQTMHLTQDCPRVVNDDTRQEVACLNGTRRI